MEKVIEFEGGYGRIGGIEAKIERCDSCYTIKLCVTSDNSEGEYVYSAICAKCINELFLTFTEESL